MSRNSSSKPGPAHDALPATAPARFIHTDLFATLVVSGIYLSILGVLVVSIVY